MSTEAFFQSGRNCESVRHADRFSLLIDGSDYFRVFGEAITRAQRTVFILGWDIDSRMKLTPEGPVDGYADALGDLLTMSQRPENGCAFTCSPGVSRCFIR
jgi:phosphatidylserine/phosphatidylglycerophosphate/cardiolipin synthase-like enzyme